jgi:exopolysaccharide biosynthesis polyprenyl glycosylphosphotransferase
VKRKGSLAFTISLILIDLLMIALAFFFAYDLRLRTEYPPAINIPPFPSYLGVMGIQIVTVVTAFFFYKLYHRKRALSHIDEFYSLFAASSIGTIVAVAFSYFILKNNPDYPRLMIAYAWVLTILLTTMGRLTHARLQWALQARGIAEQRAFIVGAGEVGQMIFNAIRRSPGLGYRVVGFVGNDAPAPEELGAPLLGTTKELPSLIKEHQVDEVIIALPEASHDEILPLISDCRQERVTIKVFPDLFQIIASEVSVADLGGLPLLTVRDIALRGWKLTLKRGLDLVVSAVGLVLLSPFMLLIALLIKLDSKGPVFYSQERMGLDSVPFQMVKFRSMKEGAEDETGPVWATKEDPRCTRVGAFLRSLSLDELPQLMNVILGEMSLVGPRPERPIFVEQFKQLVPRYMERHQEKAGMTGWAQVNGLRGDTSIVERTKYDLYYIENWSVLFDIKIILKTFLSVSTDRNSY